MSYRSLTFYGIYGTNNHRKGFYEKNNSPNMESGFLVCLLYNFHTEYIDLVSSIQKSQTSGLGEVKVKAGREQNPSGFILLRLVGIFVIFCLVMRV